MYVCMMNTVHNQSNTHLLYLESVAGPVIQATGRLEFEDVCWFNVGLRLCLHFIRVRTRQSQPSSMPEKKEKKIKKLGIKK